MKQKEYLPHKALRKYVKSYWFHEFHSPDFVPKVRHFPDGLMEWLFYWDKPPTIISLEGERLSGDHSALVCGQLTRPIISIPDGTLNMMGIRFYPYTAHIFLQHASHEFTDKIIPLADVTGKESRELEEQVAATRDHEKVVTLFDTYLLKKLAASRQVHPMVADAISQIMQSHGNIRVKNMLDRYHISERRFEVHFKDAVGVSPVFYTRLSRYFYASKMMIRKQTDSLTSVSYDAGYYDQSHFIKEWRQFTGYTPREYLLRSHIANEVLFTIPDIYFF